MLPIVGKALNVLFGTVSETELRAIKQKLIAIEEGERVLVQEAKSSLSILNITRVNLTKNRQAINRLIKGVLDVEGELGNVTVHVNGIAETEGLCEAVPATINGNQQT